MMINDDYDDDDDDDISSLRLHNRHTIKAAIHDIGVVYYPCDVKGCNYEAKAAGNLEKHKAMVPDIDVVYYSCNARGVIMKQNVRVILCATKLWFTIYTNPINSLTIHRDGGK